MKRAQEAGRSSSDAVGWCAEHGHRLARSRAVRAGDGADALQDVWVAVLTSEPPDDVASDSQRLFAWLLATLRHRIADQKRRERRRAHQPLCDSECTTDEPVSAAERAELAELVRRTLDHLATNGAPAVRLLELRFFEGLSVAEIAAALGVSARVVTARLQRAKKKFRAAWAVVGGGGDCSD